MNLKSLAGAAAFLLMSCATLPAGTLFYNGNFTQDEDVVLIPIVVSGDSLITIKTTSFADGSNGFEPVLTLFDSLGNPIDQDSTGGTMPGGCGARQIDSTSGFCLDAYIQRLLTTGTYTLALTEWDNIPGGLLSDGFPQTGNGNFTGPEFLGTEGSFVLFDGSQRTNAWALEVDGSAVPEPGTASLAIAGILSAAWLRRRASR